ncbi:hypothetical protein C445_06050 [Halobiforma lacisalsi AJ5]|uniref:Uncharacterized protein n=1 Tax=Natronobacterium lacisalsi AJ5 TaxID=358396 RepID=M0LSI0_NATLA|nr:hypothetical protein C445_06050 [Halobiforma lacisalsi AJ5]
MSVLTESFADTSRSLRSQFGVGRNVLTESNASDSERWARQDRTRERVLSNAKHSREVSVLTEI